MLDGTQVASTIMVPLFPLVFGRSLASSSLVFSVFSQDVSEK